MNVHMRVDAHRVTPILALSIDSLAARIEGRIITPDAPEFDSMRGLAHSNWDHRPLFIARVASAPDVADVIDFARRHQLAIAVRSGGHSVCGYSTVDNGVVIDLRDLRGLDVDTETMTVWVGSGLTAGQVSRELDHHRVAVGFGDSASVGVAGLTLGGGIGYLTRKFGLTVDSLIAAEIVTASGSILTIDEHSHPELFWAVRGGGGRFGVVTRFRYRLHPLPEFTGGPMVFPATPQVLASFVAAAKTAPDELTTILMAMPAPPLPFLPPEMVGKTILLGMMAYAGSAQDAYRALAPFRALSPTADLVRPGPYSIMYQADDESAPRPTISIRTLYKDDLDVDEAARLLARLEQCDAPMRVAQIRVLGGAAARVAEEATAFSNRDANMLIGFMAMDGSLEAAARHDQWAESCVAELGGARRGTYVNFLGDEGPDMVRKSYSNASWLRLQAAKHDYDPTNMFSRNHDIMMV